MQVPPQPRPALINDDPEFGDRFWYWYGASGCRYIHSVYPARHCPHLPGAVYISVYRLSESQFVPLAIEVSNPLGQIANRFRAAAGAGEVHVHLLAQCDEEVRRIRDDLKAGLFGDVKVSEMLPAADVPEARYSLLAGMDTPSVAPA